LSSPVAGLSPTIVGNSRKYRDISRNVAVNSPKINKINCLFFKRNKQRNKKSFFLWLPRRLLSSPVEGLSPTIVGNSRNCSDNSTMATTVNSPKINKIKTVCF